jgi:hypothetical protein
MNVQLNERLWTDAFEAVNLAGFDHENVASAAIEFLPVDDPSPASGPTNGSSGFRTLCMLAVSARFL